MCDKLSVSSEQFDKILMDIKSNNLSRNNIPKLIVGTGLSASFNVPGMEKLAKQLEKVLSVSKNEKVKTLWDLNSANIKKFGLEEGLKSISSTNAEFVDEIRKITARYILIEEEKLHKRIQERKSGFSKLLSYLKDTCSVNSGIIDIMTPNYDRIIELICDKLAIRVVTGFEGELYKRFNPMLLKNPNVLYNNKNFMIRLFKPHGSINWVNKDSEEYLSNDYKVLKANSDYIEIITPGNG